MANRLAKETSPYLLQHAHNPVHWYPWSEEAFERAKKEDKPVLVSIGYAACHWCHVMEKESFEDEEVASVMNKHFINIKVDREERPDVDQIYMDAVQAVSGGGGWPLNVFLTPDRKPFYGGTYFPPTKSFNRPSWTEILLAVSRSFEERRDEIELQANNLTQHLAASNSFGINSSKTDFTAAKFDEAFRNIMSQADKEWGGFGRAPKFPQTFTVNFLLTYAKLTQNRGALDQALLSLEKMFQGGIYDHVGGGFARYSTDSEWLVPHFEKMLYDNALLVSTLADAYSLTQNEAYKAVIEETLAFIERELTHPDGGFYSALDADSEGEEGKFYVWDFEEVNSIVGAEADIFCDYFDIKPGGNWEEKSIPWIKKASKEFAQQHGLDEMLLKKIIEEGKRKLLTARSKRVRPQLDDKVLLNWNALMNIAYCNAFAVTGNDNYRKVAKKNMAFLLSAFGEGSNFHHSWKNGQAKHPSFLDDYAFLIAALLEMSQITSDHKYLDKAAELTEVVFTNYADDETPYFFYTARGQKDILVRKKEIYDGATPSGNSIMAHNLYRLSILLDRPVWREKSEDMVNCIGEVFIKYPTSFGVWLGLAYEMLKGTSEIAVIGKDYRELAAEIHKLFVPHRIMMAAEAPVDKYPLLAGKKTGEKTHIFLCKNYACQQPVSTLKELLSLISGK